MNTQRQLWREKRETAPRIGDEAICLGSEQDGAVRFGFDDLRQQVVHLCDRLKFVRAVAPHIGGTLHGAILATPTEVCEGETSTKPDDRGASESDNCPEECLWQCQHHFAVTGAQAVRLETNAKELFEAYGDLRQILRRRRDAARGGA